MKGSPISLRHLIWVQRTLHMIYRVDINRLLLSILKYSFFFGLCQNIHSSNKLGVDDPESMTLTQSLLLC